MKKSKKDKMRVYLLMLVFIGLITSCSNSTNRSQGQRNDRYESTEDNYEEKKYSVYNNAQIVEEEEAFDGEYCADITYYNSNTGRQSDYTLIIEVYDNELERISFPNGWLDVDHFGYVEFDEGGYVSFMSDRGYDYTVQIIGPASGCFESVPGAYQCIGMTEDGYQCENLTDNPSGYCWQHEDQEF